MVIFWSILISLVSLIAIVVVIGLFMPERYVGQTRVRFAKGPQDVWDALQDPDRHPMTGVMKKGILEQDSENGFPAWIEDMGHDQIVVRTKEFEKPRRMVREMESKVVPMTSTWTYSLEGEGEACELTLEAVTFIRKGTWHVPIFRVLMVLGGGVKKGLDIQADMVARTLGVKPTRS